MTNEQIVNEAFKIFNLSLDDLRKILEVDYQGPGPNFVVAEVALAITEPISKVYYPFVRVRGGGQVIATSLDAINAKEAAHNFFSDCFSNSRYGQISHTIWDCFRNGHVHLFQSKKVINVPVPSFNDSFLTGVHLSGTTPTEIVVNLSQQALERSEHLVFDTTMIRNQRRPFLRFCPLIYYLDLKEALENLRNRTDADNVVKQNFLAGYQLLVEAKRLDFSGQRIPQTEKNLILTELTRL